MTDKSSTISRATRVQLFHVRDQEPLPMYINGRTVLIGDAAHATVLYQGQGANQALEDIEGLNALLIDVVNCQAIPRALEFWDSARRPRASEIVRGSRASQATLASRSASSAILAVKLYVTMPQALAQLRTQSTIGSN